MPLFRREVIEPRSAEIAAIEAPLAEAPFLPDNLDIVVVYGGHDTAKDFRALAPYLRGADIFIPEVTAWTKDELVLISRISQGDKIARTELERDHAGGKFTPFTALEMKALLGSNLFVAPIDYSADHKGADKILDHFTGWGLLDKLVPSFDKSLDNIVRFAREEGDIESYREDIMIKSIGPRLQALIEASPELQQRGRLRVVIQQGTAHTYFYHELYRLVQENPSCTVERLFDEPKPIIFAHFDRLARAHRSGIELTKLERRELAMRALARTGLRFYNKGGIPLVFHPGESRLKPVSPDEMADRIDPETIRDFHRRVVKGRNR